MTDARDRVALVVDPETDSRELYADILMAAAITIDYAEDGREALAKAMSHRPNVVIMETRLPFIDGYALCSLLRAEPLTAGVPIVVISKENAPGHIERARSSGADSVLIKPCVPETLLQALARGRNRLSDRTDGRARSGQSEAQTTASSARGTHRILVRAHRRFETTTPPVAPPPLRCPSCDRPLQYLRSHIGGVSERHSEQWDYYTCHAVCGTFQYRQRTRRLRQVR